MKLFLQGLFAFELIMMVATFVSHMIVIVLKEKVPLKIYGIVFIITIIMYELAIIGLM